ncbi:MAG: RDD family protein [Deltaproteobacteria bacterium]|nr:RDD family protein [Deltaproteobacteria bacterium]
MAEDSPYSKSGEDYDELPSFPKTEILERLLAKFIDFLLVGALFTFPSFIGPLAAITYIMISDGFKGGQSIGKRIIGLRVISTRGAGAAAPCDFKQSIIRNGMFGGLIVLYFILWPIPYVGKLIVFLAWAAAIGAEIMLIYSDESGARFGDRLADTLVVSARADKGV